VTLSAGVATPPDATVLAPAQTLDGYGLLSTPPESAAGLPANAVGRTPASPKHPPGLYGPESGRQALNLGANLPLPVAAPVVPGARVETLTTQVTERALGPWLLAAAVALLTVDLLIALALRGLLRPGVAAVRASALALACVLGTHAAWALDSNSNPALAPLTTEHVLARSFYLLSDFPGRYTGDTVWVQRDQDRTNDSVSPVIVGGNDWAAAWAVDADGRNPYAVIPGGARQRTLAYRFGVNLVMYALTGNYKGDQVHVPAILQRLGQ
jgi:hypothetical protein